MARARGTAASAFLIAALPTSAVTIPTLISLGANTTLDNKSPNVKKQAPAKNEDFSSGVQTVEEGKA